jgi:hypothetical protein
MSFIFQPVTIAGDTQDSEGVLAFDGGSLVAVLTRLSDMHGDMEGRWFIEAMFGDAPPPLERTFETLQVFEDSLAAD